VIFFVLKDKSGFVEVSAIFSRCILLQVLQNEKDISPTAAVDNTKRICGKEDLEKSIFGSRHAAINSKPMIWTSFLSEL
jgi:hypothetical protein